MMDIHLNGTMLKTLGSKPLRVRHREQYKQEYVEAFVEKWDELVDWDARAESESGFFISMLKAHGKKRILDVSTGTGFHSVQLLHQRRWQRRDADQGVRECEAAQLDLEYGPGGLALAQQVNSRYDAVICLGNSFTHLFDEMDRRRALAEFYATLHYDGILILDQRNYDAILDVGFKSTHKYYYCGNEVVAEPEYVDPALTRFRYAFPDGSVFHLNMFPLRKTYLRNLLMEAGFLDVETYGDFQEYYDECDRDFFIHIAAKHH